MQHTTIKVRLQMSLRD